MLAGALMILIHFIPLLLCLLTRVFAAVQPWTPPLSTRGRYVVDANGNRFKLISGNWHGASGTYSGSGDINQDSSHHSSENAHTLPLGLQYASIDEILDGFEKLNINSIRLPFSNQMIHDTTPVQDAWVAANPQFKGLTPLQVYDAVIKAVTARGIAVILNNHTNKSIWCCGANDGNDRWNKSQSDDTWAADWIFMVQRYRSNPRVVGADLYNEVRRDLLDDPNWGLYDEHDWYRYSQWVGNRILREANPDILIIVEGINWVGIPVDGFYHHRPTLEPVGTLSHTLVNSHKLVYSAHFYGYTGPSHSGATGLGETSDPRYRDLSQSDLWNTMKSQAGYVAFDADKHYTNPVWISEFGVSGRGVSDLERTWFINMVTWLVDNDLDFAIWPLIGYLGPNNDNGWALLNWNPSTGKQDSLYDGNDWRADTWTRLVAGGSTGSIANSTRWQMLNMDNEDFIPSLIQSGRGDWDSGARKAMCPDGLRLVGISHASSRGLCTDASYGNNLWASGSPTTTVWDERYVSHGDWAGGYTKYECPTDAYVVGWAIRGKKVSTVLCAQANRSLGLGGSGTRWLDRGDVGPVNDHGDFHSGNFKGACESDEYIAGIAFTTRVGSDGSPAAILCRK